MKFIHTADIHLGSQLNLKLSREKIEERRLEIRSTFKNIVELANKEGAKAIILAGDIFDGERALKKDKEFFYNVVKSNPQIDFLYLRGNHDIKEGFNESYNNLKLFSDEWTYYEYDGVTVAGIELTNKNASSFYQTLNLKEKSVNLVALHGQVSDSVGEGLISVTKLKDKFIDYLALGHVHFYKEYKLDARGKYAYSGCPEGRGFDETGEKGVVLLEVSDGSVYTTFVPTAKREISNVIVDCTGLLNSYDVYGRIKEEAKLKANNLYRIELIGEVEFDTEGIEEELSEYLQKDCYLVKVKDKLFRKIDIDSLKDSLSLKGEFLKEVLTSDLTDNEKSSIVNLGLKALSGREI